MPTTLLSLLDDIASLLDDVAAMTKIATKKTAGVLGDDLALNAEQVAGVQPNRELPVVWAVARGSAKNKLILVPAALAISTVAHWAITPLLMIGGSFLCYEGFEKVVHKFTAHRHEVAKEEEHRVEVTRALADPNIDIVALEKEKIAGAIRTDFILSAEIIVISLGAIAEATFVTQVASLVAIAALMTVGVYALVAGIVKLDDLGLHLRARPSKAAQALGSGILATAPYLMKALALAGTVAMFLVGGGIITHGFPVIEQRVAQYAKGAGALGVVLPTLADLLVGMIVGAIILSVVLMVRRLRNRDAK